MIRAALLAAALGLLAAGPAAAHHVGTYVPRDNAVSADFKAITFAVRARKFDVARRLFEQGELRTQMRARAAGLPAGLEAGTAAALSAGDAGQVERHLLILLAALARDLARDADRWLADSREDRAARLAAGRRFLGAIWRYYNLIDFAVSMRDSKTSVGIRLAFDEAESSVKDGPAPAAVGGAGPVPVPAADPDRLRGPLGRIARLLDDLIAALAPSRRNS